MPKLIKTRVEMEGRTYEEYALVEGAELPPWEAGEELGIVGYPAPRVDGAERASGEARYTVDVRLAGMAYTAMVTCPHPHARLRRLDVEAARTLPGVYGILTRAELHARAQGAVRARLTDTLRYAGEIVAVVAARDPDTAEDAARLIVAEYERLPHVTTIEAALAPGAPQVSPAGNIYGGKPEVGGRGDLAVGMAEAEITLDRTYTVPSQLHSCLEPHGAVAHWEGEDLTVYESTQHVFGTRNTLARWLGLPQHRVRVICTFMGGGFGSKGGASITSLWAAALARQIRRPVQLYYERPIEQVAGGHRSPAIMQVRLGARRDGTLTAIEFVSQANLGAYPGWVPLFAGPAAMQYRCAHVRHETTGVLTNTGTFEAFRAPGFVEGAFALESAMDELAAMLGMDPLELRRRNIPDHDQHDQRAFSNFPIDECYRQGAERIGWERGQHPAEGGRYRRGIGMASQIWWGGGGPPAYATVELNRDGTATLRTGTQDIGTGTRTVLTQVCAEELGVPTSAIRTLLGDTQGGQYAPVSGGSMTVPSLAPAVRMAAYNARRELLDVVAQMYDVQPAQLEVRDGVIFRDGVRLATIAELLRKLGDVSISGRGSRGPNPDGITLVTSGAQFVEVEVDTVTGRVRVLRVVAAHDCGRIINPLTFRSQMEGGIIQGIGYALMEQRRVDAYLGLQLSANLGDYKVPTMADIPAIDVLRIDIPDLRANPTGAKGAGEPPIIPTAAAIANAVADALGVRFYELPITPDKVLNALQR